MRDGQNAKNEKVRKEILKAAIDLAKAGGWEAVSVRKISQQIGYSTIMIYSFFGSKEKLFFELREWSFTKLLAHYRLIKEDTNIVLSLTHETLDFYFKNRELYQLMFGVVGIQGVKDICSESSSPMQTAIYIKEKLKEELEGDIDSLFFNWWALIHGFISIGSTMSDQDFKGVLPYLDDAIARFMKR